MGEAAAGGLGFLGAIGGGQRQSTDNLSSVIIDQAGGAERRAGRTASVALRDLQSLSDVQGGTRQVRQANQAAGDLVSRLQQLAGSDFMPTQEQQRQAASFAETQFASRRMGLDQAFEEQSQRTAQLAAQLGRPVNDPILQARLAQEQTRQLGQLGAEQQAFSTQQAFGIADRQREGQIGALESIFNVRQGLASQAFRNRQALVELGSQLQAQGQKYRIATSAGNSRAEFGGGVAGATAGAIAGVGAGAKAASSFPGG